MPVFARLGVAPCACLGLLHEAQLQCTACPSRPPEGSSLFRCLSTPSRACTLPLRPPCKQAQTTPQQGRPMPKTQDWFPFPLTSLLVVQGYGPDAFGHTPALGRPQGNRQPDRQARGSRQDPVGSPLGPPTGPPVGYAEGPPVGTQGGPLSREPSQGRISREASQGRMSRERSWQVASRVIV